MSVFAKSVIYMRDTRTVTQVLGMITATMQSADLSVQIYQSPQTVRRLAQQNTATIHVVTLHQ